VPLFQYPDPPHISVSDGKVQFLALSISDFRISSTAYLLLTFQSFCQSILKVKFVAMTQTLEYYHDSSAGDVHTLMLVPAGGGAGTGVGGEGLVEEGLV
jgi:hypothetical protein